jgi:hypothetical protein
VVDQRAGGARARSSGRTVIMEAKEKQAYHTEYMRNWRARHRQRYNKLAAKHNRLWRLANPAKHRLHGRKYRLKKNYGISIGQYRDLLKTQGGKCAICLVHLEDSARIDHCHNTGQVRGLLCGKCNTAIGFLNDNPELLRRAADYLTPLLKVA